jgi:hypothetical protein
MGYIIRVSDSWEMRECEALVECLKAQDFDESIVVRDSDMEAFEYDELENVTVYEDDVAELLGIDGEEQINKEERQTLYYGLE